MRWIFSLAVLLMLTSIALAADVTGTWKGTMDTPMGAMENTITLKVAGDKLSGAVKTEMFEANIENAKLNGDKVSFVINMDFGTLTYEGALAGEDLKLNVTGPDGSLTPLICKRQK
jgi:hypothetical protein